MMPPPLQKGILLVKFHEQEKSKNNFLCVITYFTLVFSLILILPEWALAQGGCGSVCVPLDALDPEKTQVQESQLRILITTEYAKFDNFREGSHAVSNPGGNQASISQTTLFIDYDLSKLFTTSLLIPYIH